MTKARLPHRGRAFPLFMGHAGRVAEHLWDDLDDETRKYLIERANGFFNGDIRRAVLSLLVEAKDRHWHYLRLGVDTNTAEPEDLWGSVDAENQEKRAGRDQDR